MLSGCATIYTQSVAPKNFEKRSEMRRLTTESELVLFLEEHQLVHQETVSSVGR